MPLPVGIGGHTPTVLPISSVATPVSAAATTGDRFGATGVAAPMAPVTGGGPVGAAQVWHPPTALPATVGLGVATIDRYEDPRVVASKITVTVFTPIPTDEFPGEFMNLNAKASSTLLPNRAIIGDAGHTRSFVGIDKRPGTPLDKALAKIEAKIPKGPTGQPTLDGAVEWLRANVNTIVKWAPGSTFNDGRPGLPWDKKIKVPDSVWGPFGQVATEVVGHEPKSASATFPVVPLERYLEVGQGYCIHKALVAALVLERMGFGCRIANGAVAKSPGLTTGHTWLELEDGRILDVAWSRCEKPSTEKDPMFPRRFKYGGSWRFENQCYPYIGWPT